MLEINQHGLGPL